MSLLSVRNVKKSFGALAALGGVSLDVAEGEILGIIGPNGAGKSTLFNVIVGVHKPDAGELVFRGKSIDRFPPYKICRTGIVKTSQIVQPFHTLTVKENVLVALMFGQGFTKKEASGRADEILRLPQDSRRERQDVHPDIAAEEAAA